MSYLRRLLDTHAGEGLSLHYDHINPQFAKVLTAIGFDKNFERGSGPYLYDNDGEQYLDCISGYSCFNMGRNHPLVKEIMHEAIDLDAPNLLKMGTSVLAGLLAKELVNLTPDGVDKVYFGSSGTEVVETALKYARCATGRSQIVHCKGSFHGLSMGSLSVNGDPYFREGFGDLLPGIVQVPFNDLDALERALVDQKTAAFIFECIQGKGVRVADQEFLREAAQLCKRYGTVMIADEIQHGLGRTGRWFCYEHYDLEPDIVLVAKSLSAGFVPVAAAICRTAIYEKVFSSMERCVVHSSTFSQNSMAMAAGLAALKVIDEEKLVHNADRRGAELRNILGAIAAEGELIREVRGKGLMLGIEFGPPKSLRAKMGWTMLHKANAGLFAQAVVMTLLSEHRLLSQVPGNKMEVIRLLPTLTIGDQEIAWIDNAFRQTMRQCHTFPGAVWDAGKTLAKLAVKTVFDQQKRKTADDSLTN